MIVPIGKYATGIVQKLLIFNNIQNDKYRNT